MQKKSILFNSSLGVLAIFIVILFACTSKKNYKQIPAVNFNKELAAYALKGGISELELQKMRTKHGRFFDLWFYEIADFKKFGPLPDSIQAVYLSEFLLRNKPVFQSMEKHYASYPKLNEEISNAFGKLNELIGDVKAPVIYNYFSQFSNYNTFVDTNKGKTILAYSAEMFMNDTFPLYKLLEVPEFFNRYNSTGQLPAMLLWNYLKARFEQPEKVKTMLDEAVFNGKIWYTISQVLPSDEIWKILGYTETEWKMMVGQEGQIWRHYLNENALFSSDFNHYKRYFTYGNRTFGSGIPEDCPPLIGNFSGYRIVSDYMKNKKSSLADLWKTQDATAILRMSAYNPLK